jgi:hypothetical protein
MTIPRPAVVPVNEKPLSLAAMRVVVVGAFNHLGRRNGYGEAGWGRVPVVVCEPRIPGSTGATFLTGVRTHRPDFVRTDITGTIETSRHRPRSLVGATLSCRIGRALPGQPGSRHLVHDFDEVRIVELLVGEQLPRTCCFPTLLFSKILPGGLGAGCPHHPRRRAQARRRDKRLARNALDLKTVPTPRQG